jgi:hypothetical protein
MISNRFNVKITIKPEFTRDNHENVLRAHALFDHYDLKHRKHGNIEQLEDGTIYQLYKSVDVLSIDTLLTDIAHDSYTDMNKHINIEISVIQMSIRAPYDANSLKYCEELIKDYKASL